MTLPRRTSRATPPVTRHVHTGTAPSGDSALVEVRGLRKEFETLDRTVVACDDVSFDIARGEAVVLTGPSGSGKSTLLHLIGALDARDSGTIRVDGRDLTTMSRGELARHRRGVGFVFQRFNLLPTLTVIDNVIAPTLPFTVDYDREGRARELLARVDLAGRDHTLATRLSGGQQQRVAIARALMNDPKLVVADEPTGNLDSETGEAVMELLLDLREHGDATLVVATHDLSLAARFDRTLHVRDGRIDD